MSPFKSRSLAKADEPAAEPADLVQRAGDALAAAVAADRELAALHTRLPELREMRATAEADFAEARRRSVAKALEAEALLAGGKFPERPVSAEELENLRRRLEVTAEACKLAEDRIPSRRLEIARALWGPELAEQLRLRGASLALRIAAVVADAMSYDRDLQSLMEAGFRLVAAEAWRPLPVFPDPRDENTAAVETLRQAVRASVTTEAQIVEAAGGSVMLADALTFGTRRRHLESIARGRAELERTEREAAQARAEAAARARAEKQAARAMRQHPADAAGWGAE